MLWRGAGKVSAEEAEAAERKLAAEDRRMQREAAYREEQRTALHEYKLRREKSLASVSERSECRARGLTSLRSTKRASRTLTRTLSCGCSLAIARPRSSLLMLASRLRLPNPNPGPELCDEPRQTS